MSQTELSIGQLSKQTGCKVPTIRYYEQIGLLPPPPRSEGNQRRYGKTHLERLRFICHARELGFAIDSVRQLLQLSSGHRLHADADQQQEGAPGPLSDCVHGGVECHNADEIAREHLLEVERKIASLSSLRDELQAMISACQSGRAHSCRVIEVLSDHRLCHSDHRH